MIATAQNVQLSDAACVLKPTKGYILCHLTLLIGFCPGLTMCSPLATGHSARYAAVKQHAGSQPTASTCMCADGMLCRFDYVQSLELNAEEQAVSVAVNSNGAPGAVSAAGLDAVDNVHEANRYLIKQGLIIVCRVRCFASLVILHMKDCHDASRNCTVAVAAEHVWVATACMAPLFLAPACAHASATLVFAGSPSTLHMPMAWLTPPPNSWTMTQAAMGLVRATTEQCRGVTTPS